MLFLSINGIRKLLAFVESFYLEVQKIGATKDDECWRLTCTMVRAFFLELSKVRAIAADAGSNDGPVQRCSLFLWASLQSKRITGEFIRAGFCFHPALAPHINMHVFRCRTTVSAHEDLKNKHRDIKRDHDLLSKKLDGVIAQVTSLKETKT